MEKAHVFSPNKTALSLLLCFNSSSLKFSVDENPRVADGNGNPRGAEFSEIPDTNHDWGSTWSWQGIIETNHCIDAERNSATLIKENCHLNRLPTRQRLVGWGMQISPDCCLCSNFEESRDHLLLLCDYSAQIWRLVMAKLSPNQQTFRGWEDLFHWLNAHLSGPPSTLKKIMA